MLRRCFWRAMISGSGDWSGFGVEGLRRFRAGVTGGDEVGNEDGSADVVGVLDISVFETGVEG